jgi:SAM-dependent methyltransferase
VGGGHAARIERAFTAQAGAFEDPARNRAFTADAAWMLAGLPVGPDDLVLDVAAGTGIVARALAPRARAVVALDATAAMLQAGRDAAVAEGAANVLFMLGDATALPFLDASFDVAVTRFSLHHLEEPALAVAEMARCLRPGGRALVADIVAAEDPGAAREQDRLERLRDPSHARLQTAAGLAALLRHAGLGAVRVETRDLERPLGDWLGHTGTDEAAAAEIEAALRRELAGGPPTGFRPVETGGEVRFTHRYAAAIASAPPTARG